MSGQTMLDRLRNIPTSALANALDDMGFCENVLKAIKPVAPGAKLVGLATTVKESIGKFGTFSSADFSIGKIIDTAGMDNVIVIDEGGAPYSTWGGLASLAAKEKGIQGIIVDG